MFKHAFYTFVKNRYKFCSNKNGIFALKAMI